MNAVYDIHCCDLTTGGKLAAIFLPISAFVALGTDHSVANSK
jgi:formate/nitrite transporter FocA (FNT family)